MLGIVSFAGLVKPQGRGNSSAIGGKIWCAAVTVLLSISVSALANPYKTDPGQSGLSKVATGHSGAADRLRSVRATSGGDKQDGGGASEPTKPVIVEGPTAEGLTPTSALISWKTPLGATGTVQYGLAEDALDQTASTTMVDGTQQVSLTSLSPGTEYFVRVDTAVPDTTLTDQSRVIRFTTPTVADTRAPQFLSAPVVAGISDTKILISWTTDEAADAEVIVSDELGVAQVVEAIPATIQSIVVSGLTADTAYDFQVNATDTSGNRSSAALAATTASTGDATDPVIVDGLVVEYVTDNAFHLRWQTSKPSTSTVKYGETEAFEFSSTLPGLRLEHHVVIAGLDPETVYGMQIDSQDWTGNGPAETETLLLVTLKDPLTATPTITTVPQIAGVTDTTATIYWETNEPSDSYVNFGIGTARGLRAGSPALALRHQVVITGLTPGQVYGFNCESTDLDGQTGLTNGDALQFTTASEADTTAPVLVEGPEVVAATDEGFTIEWRTDELSDGIVRYGAAGSSLDEIYADGHLSTEHRATLRGLASSSDFEFTVSGADIAGNNSGESAVVAAETVAAADTDGPEFVSDPVVSEIDRNTALLSWETDELSSADIAIGFSAGDYELIQATPGLGTVHSVLLTNLDAGTNYTCVLRVADQNQNTTLSESIVFTTEGVVLTGVPSHVFLPVGQNRAIQVRSPHPGDTSFLFSSDNPSVVTVSNRGVMLGVAEGQARILVTGIASRSTSEILVDVYTLQKPNTNDLTGFYALLSIFLLQDGQSGIGGPCFIATAASGTPLSGEVAVLRAFRDQWLLTNTPGTMLVDAYYHVSPPIADAVAASPALALVVRLLLLPVLLFAALWMKSPLLVLTLTVAVGWRMWRRARIAQANIG